jgi:hypothetical protein
MKRIFPVLITAFAILFSPMPLAFAADTSAPLLVDWTLQNSSADISTSSRTVSVKFILSDDSKINEPKLLVKSLETTQISSFAIVKEVAKSGKLVSYEAIATINLGQAPREWEWVLYPLSDELGNTNSSFGPGGVWPVKVRVFDKTYTYANYNNVGNCLFGLRAFNRALTRFLALQKSDPSNVQLSVLKLKYTLPESVIDEKLCETQTDRITTVYGPNQAVELADALVPVQDEIDLKNAKAAQAARDVQKCLVYIGVFNSRISKYLSLKSKDPNNESLAVLKLKYNFPDSIIKSDLCSSDTARILKLANTDTIIDDELNRVAEEIDAKEAKAASPKKTTLTCVKGKLTKKVTAVKPKCPSGYKVKK